MAPRTRWMFYAVAGAATVAAMVWVDEGRQGEDASGVVQAVRPRAPAAPAGTSAPAPAPGDDTQVRLDQLRRRAGEDVPRSDPFSTAPMVAAQEAQKPPAPPPPPPPPPQAPPLPFSYLGKWTEKGLTTIFLAHGERHVSVRGPGKLDDTYAVESIGANEIVLTYLPLGIRQVLPMTPGATAAAASPASAPDAGMGDNNEEQN